MFDAQTEHGLAPTTPFVLGYQRFVEEIERALWDDGAGNVSEAYQEYTNAYAEALADPMVYQRVASALQRLTDALAEALERAETRSLIDESVGRYLEDVGASWPELRGDAGDLESLVALATGATTIAWLRGLGASGLVGPFGAIDLLAPEAPQSWSSPAAGDGYAGTDGGGSWSEAGFAAETEGDLEPDSADDDGIVWQELAVGDDGRIVQRSATPRQGSARHSSSNGPSVGRAPAAGAAQSGATTGADPVGRVDRAYQAYVEGLRAAGLPVAPSDGADAAPAPPETGSASARSQLERRSAELTAAYLRLAQGVGSVPDLFLSYARFLGSASELVERELALLGAYERLMTASLRGGRPAQQRQAADLHYRRFLAAVREVWTQVDPAMLPPDRLSELATITARAAAVNERALTGLWPSAP
jgi:hypothetical protein